MTPEQAADAVLAAVKTKDAVALKTLATRATPDPWFVADILIARDQRKAAEDYARTAPGPDTERLAEYVGRAGDEESDAPARRALARAVAALSERQLEGALGILSDAKPASGSVVHARILFVRGEALRDLGRLEESVAAFSEAAETARRIGWLVWEVQALHETGSAAWSRSDYATAVARWTELGAACERRGDRKSCAATLGNLGVVHASLGEHIQALAFYERALAMVEAMGDRAGIAAVFVNMGNLKQSLGDFVGALSFHERALALLEPAGDPMSVARVLGNIGNVHQSTGDYAQALEFQERALAALERAGERRGVAATLGNIGNVHQARGDYLKALAFHERAFAIREAIDDRSGVAMALVSIGLVHQALGDLSRALAFQERALSTSEALGDRAGVARSVGNIGILYTALGDYPKALSSHERALALLEALGSRADAAGTLVNLGNVHLALGDLSKALGLYERALETQEALGDRAAAARALGNIGLVHHSQGDRRTAISFYQRALARKESLGDRAGAADTLLNIGSAYHELGEYDTALSFHERAHDTMASLGDRAGVAAALGNIGLAFAARLERQKALVFLDRSVREARRLRLGPVLVGSLTALARLRLEMNEPARALAAAQQAIREVEGIVGGLAEEEGATTRARFHEAFGIGVVAAARLGENRDALTFLESGRAGALMEMLGGRRGLRWADIPPDLHRAEAEAKAAEAVARREHDRLLESASVAEIRRAGRAVDDALERRREVSTRIQREAKRAASLLYPRAATMEEVQGGLERNQALVLFGFALDEVWALVLTPETDRMIRVGTAAGIRGACAGLDASRRDTDPAAALAALRTLLVEPLGLSETVDELLVSPQGPLCYLPFGALFDRRVALVPSGTAFVLLQGEERSPGEGVLAFGDPQYGAADATGAAVYSRGQRLTPLPETRTEVNAIGTVVLLGADANEGALRKAFSSGRRRRAVHFACHAIVNAERPTLSALALSPSAEDDGFLTALEVLRLEMPADLAVLSACATATGRLVDREGLVGLMTAFMYAGPPRVICSLWKVDDEATRALMVKFYELWSPKDGKPGLPTATALKLAQEFVRSHEKWKHPYYWAAWVLWGLPS